MAEGNPRCEHCRTALNSSKPSVREIVINSVSALLLLAILVPLGWQIKKAEERLSQRFVRHLLWREPLEDWSR
jgi:hypothetical protein